MRASRLAAEAAGWAVRLSPDDVGEADWLAFAGWLDAGGEAARDAFDQAQALWLELDAHRDELRGEPEIPARSRGRRRRAIGAGALAAGLCAAALLAVQAARTVRPAGTAASPVQVYATGVGGVRTVHLADGSSIELDSRSRLAVAYGAVGRRVRLDEGQALFRVSHNPARPFVVEVGGGRVTDLGTVFDLARYDRSTRVSVLEGRVEYQVAGQAVQLRRGTLAVRTDGSGAIRIRASDPASAAAWTEGRLVYRDSVLGEVVSDLNRHYAQPIQLADPSVARTPFTGVLVLGPQAAVVRRLTALTAMQAHRSGGAYVLASRGP